MEQGAGSPAGVQFGQKIDGEPAFVGTESAGCPFGAVGIVDRNEGRFAAHGEAHIARAEIGVDDVAESGDLVPLLFRIGPGDARRFEDAMHGHAMAKLGFAFLEHAGNRRGAGGIGSAGKRNVTFTGEETGGGIEADPSGAGR